MARVGKNRPEGGTHGIREGTRMEPYQILDSGGEDQARVWRFYRGPALQEPPPASPHWPPRTDPSKRTFKHTFSLEKPSSPRPERPGGSVDHEAVEARFYVVGTMPQGNAYFESYGGWSLDYYWRPFYAWGGGGFAEYEDTYIDGEAYLSKYQAWLPTYSSQADGNWINPALLVGMGPPYFFEVCVTYERWSKSPFAGDPDYPDPLAVEPYASEGLTISYSGTSDIDVFPTRIAAWRDADNDAIPGPS